MKTGPHIYVLNLDRHKARLENMRHQLEILGLAWERIAAVDAQQASEEELKEYTDATGPIPRMGAGARACTVGHFKIWKTFLETDAPVAFILEDDVRISERFSDFVEAAPSYSNEVDILNFNRQNSKREQKKLVVSKINPLIDSTFEGKQLLGPHYGTAGYMITRSTAERLCHRIKRTNVPIDHLLFNPNVSTFNRSSRIYQAFPAIVEPDVEKFQTSIQKENIPTSTHWWKKLARLYYETNRIPSMLTHYILGRAEIQILDFDASENY
ncbi:glycosyltransferase family 25 protein [Cycloclasticus sp.]|uniref:glycosyltransferase family 25 protein n=1 Tax=Cycloclasticus sp. TaxID=2024830 RepID=UPI00257ACF77|nr:glycosyltransferase family 25 protein [Cycloclasticus sp.]